MKTMNAVKKKFMSESFKEMMYKIFLDFMSTRFQTLLLEGLRVVISRDINIGPGIFYRQDSKQLVLGLHPQADAAKPA